LPYTDDRATYATAPHFDCQAPRPEPTYWHEVMRYFYEETEYKVFARVRSLPIFLLTKLLVAASALQFFASIALLPPLITLRRVFLDRRIRFLEVRILVWPPA
jgi:hypothetical protein